MNRFVLWLAGLFAPNAKLNPKAPFSPRAIFQYWDGNAARAIDPMVAYRGLVAHPKFNAETHLALADAGDLEAIAIVVEATRDTFGVKPFRNWKGDHLGEMQTEGLTETETVELLASFFAYCDSVKKNTSRSQTFPGSTVQQQSAASASAEFSTSGSVFSGCGLTCPEPKGDAQPAL